MGSGSARFGALLAFAVASGCGDAAEPAPAARPAQCVAGRDQPLLPADPALRRSARTLVVGAGHSVVAHAGGVALQILSVSQDGGPAAPSFERTEYGLDASFGRGCTLYSVTLTCDRAGDARCADERHLRGLIAGLSPRWAAGLR